MKTLIKIGIPVLIITSIVLGVKVYNVFFKSAIQADGSYHTLYIPTGSNYEDVLSALVADSIIVDVDAFDWLAKKMNYPNHVYPGRYSISNQVNYRGLIKKLRSGKQAPVHVVINKYRSKEKLVGFVSGQLELDSTKLIQLLNNAEYLKQYNLDNENVMAIFLSDKYEFYWNTDADQFFKRMLTEFEKYWQNGRKNKVKRNELDPIKAVILASIVEEESNKIDERSTIAGVYINRLKKGMKLQADPTVKFAVGDFQIRRVLNKHLKFESPYNTYLVKGLPPGPICTPSKNAIESVINAESHGYLYFCAREDFSGYHVFAKNYRAHLNNAHKFQKALNKRKILK